MNTTKPDNWKQGYDKGNRDTIEVALLVIDRLRIQGYYNMATATTIAEELERLTDARRNTILHP